MSSGVGVARLATNQEGADAVTGIEPSDFLARFGIGVLFVFLSLNLFKEFLATHRVSGLLLLVSEAPFDDLQLLKLDQICHADFHACHFCAGRLPAGSAYRHAGRR